MIICRAYKLEEKILKQFQKEVDVNGNSWFAFLMCARWLGFRLDLESSIVLVFASFLAVLLRDQVNLGLIGFALVYTLSLSGSLQYAVRMSSEVENQMTSVERINTYSCLPPEKGYRYDSLTSASEHNDDDNIELKTIKSSEGHLELRNLTVKYRLDLDCVLKSINLDIPAG